MVSCLMGDSTALASAIVRCCPKFNIREQDPQKYSAVKAEQDKLSAICGVQMKIARICPYCGHTVSIVYKGDHSYTQEKCSKCGETVTFPPISFRLSK